MPAVMRSLHSYDVPSHYALHHAKYLPRAHAHAIGSLMLSMRIYPRHGIAIRLYLYHPAPLSFSYFRKLLHVLVFEPRAVTDIICSYGLRPFLCKFGFIYC